MVLVHHHGNHNEVVHEQHHAEKIPAHAQLGARAQRKPGKADLHSAQREMPEGLGSEGLVPKVLLLPHGAQAPLVLDPDQILEAETGAILLPAVVHLRQLRKADLAPRVLHQQVPERKCLGAVGLRAPSRAHWLLAAVAAVASGTAAPRRDILQELPVACEIRDNAEGSSQGLLVGSAGARVVTVIRSLDAPKFAGGLVGARRCSAPGARQLRGQRAEDVIPAVKL
mmetsp:Transcript_20621/g.56907  ORF Transcript_20621/g.56907 Transcript_20621/m.56907 type:complete len:226 (-) Transcript_20621:122-799(-)